MQDYQAAGGRIANLVQKQLLHLTTFLDGRVSEDDARNTERIGEVHYRHRIEPVWIMGAYLLYLEHLQSLIRTSPEVRGIDYEPLDAAVTKLLFRDMGLMLEGYWDTARALHLEQDKVVNLQEQITSLLANIPQMLWSVDVINNRLLYVSPSARELQPGRRYARPVPRLDHSRRPRDGAARLAQGAHGPQGRGRKPRAATRRRAALVPSHFLSAGQTPPAASCASTA